MPVFITFPKPSTTALERPKANSWSRGRGLGCAKRGNEQRYPGVTMALEGLILRGRRLLRVLSQAPPYESATEGKRALKGPKRGQKGI